MTILEAVLQGILQGLTEFLPVSSSGHLSLFQHFFGMDGENAVTITLVMHLGTLVAVFVAFWAKIKQLIIEAFSMLKDIFTLKFVFKDMNEKRRMICLIFVSILPLFGFVLLKDEFSSLASDASILVEGVGFLYTSALIFLSTSKSFDNGTKTAGSISFKSALSIGFFQGVALIPGVSRSGSTISAALLAKMKREDAVEYSFILGIPVILAGALVELLDVGGVTESIGVLSLIVSFVTAAVVGYFAIALIKIMVVSDKYKYFGFYTAVLGVLVIGVAIYEMISGNRIVF